MTTRRTKRLTKLPRLRTIVVPLDGLEESEKALPVALALAERAGATVDLVNVVEAWTGIDAVAEQGEGGSDRGGSSYLANVRSRYGGERTVTHVLRARPTSPLVGGTSAIVAALAGYARRRRADLVVMTSHGRGGMSRVWLGSVADALLRRSTAPVLLVHPELPADAHRFRRVVLALDGSALSEQMLPHALRLARLTSARVTLLRVVVPVRAVARPAPVSRVDAKALERERTEAERYLSRALAWAPGDVTLDTAVVAHESPAQAIVDFAAERRADLIAITTRGRGGASRFMFGSVADKTLRGSPVSVLVHRPTVEQRETG